MSVWNDIFDCLLSAGYDVFQPASHTGECVKTYIVVKHGTQTRHPNFSTNVQLYDVLIYVPLNKYGTLEPTVNDVEKRMRSLLPKVKPTGNKTPPYYDSEVKGYMVSIEYKNYRLERGLN